MTNIENKISKATDPNGKKLPPGITYRKDRETYCVKFTGLDGKRHEKSFKNPKEATAYQHEMEYLKDKGIILSDHKITVNELFEQYYQKESNFCRANTLETYKQRYVISIKPDIGTKKVIDVRHQDCQDILIKMYKAEYGRSTIKGTDTVLRKMFQFAVNNEILLKSPANGLRIPKGVKGATPIPFLRESEIPLFLAAAEKYFLYPQIVLILETGLRIGEVMALRWSNVDFEKNELYVTHNLVQIKGKWTFGPTKSKNGNRTIPLTERARNILLRQREKDFTLPIKEDYGHLIFRSRNGEPIPRSNYDFRIKEICQKAGVTVVSAHGLRHTFITKMRLEGMNPLILDRIIGHAERNVTDDVYVHIPPEKLHDEIRKFA